MPRTSDPFEEMKKQERALNARLAKAPLVDLIGVVDASGPGGGKAQGERLWTLRFAFDVWRIAGGPLRSDKLEIRRKVTDRQLNAYQRSIQPYAVLRLRAHVLDEPRSSSGLMRGSAADASLVKVIGRDRRDTELRQHAAAFQKPVIRKDSVLGKLTLDRRLNWYEAKAKWNGKSVKVQLSPDEGRDDSLVSALRTAHTLWRDQRKWSRRITDFAIKKLLDLKNDTWRDEDEPRLSKAEFARRMKLESITVNPDDGSFTFWHDDGDLFWGHTIQVSGNLKRGPTDADIAG